MKRWISLVLIISMVLGSICNTMPIRAADHNSVEGTLSSTANKIKEKANDIKANTQDASKNVGDIASKKAFELSKAASNIANKTLSNLGIQADKASKNITRTAKKTKNAASKGMAMAGAALAEASSKIDNKKIADGWKFTGKLSGTKLAAELGSKKYTDYIDGISNAIEDMRKDVNHPRLKSQACRKGKEDTSPEPHFHLPGYSQTRVSSAE